MIQVHKNILDMPDEQLQAWLNSLAMRGSIISVAPVGDFWYVILYVEKV